jgi:hypothetical protein
LLLVLGHHEALDGLSDEQTDGAGFNIVDLFFFLLHKGLLEIRAWENSLHVCARARTCAHTHTHTDLFMPLKSSSNCLRFLPPLPVPAIFPSVRVLEDVYPREMWPVQLASLRLFCLWCYFLPWRCLILHFLHYWYNWSSPSFCSTTFQNFRDISDLLPKVSKFQHQTKRCTK